MFRHEYRFAYGVIAFGAILTGLIDALISDWCVKAFAWSAVIFAAMSIIAYEFIVMPTPRRPKLQAVLFVLFSWLGWLSIHHWVWLFTSMIVYNYRPGKTLWLAPNIVVDTNLYNTLMAISLAAYIAYGLVQNAYAED